MSQPFHTLIIIQGFKKLLWLMEHCYVRHYAKHTALSFSELTSVVDTVIIPILLMRKKWGL